MHGRHKPTLLDVKLYNPRGSKSLPTSSKSKSPLRPLRPSTHSESRVSRTSHISSPSKAEFVPAIKISEWPSTTGITLGHEKEGGKIVQCNACCVPFYSKIYGTKSILKGKRVTKGRPEIPVIDYFISQLDNPNSKTKIRGQNIALITKSKKYTYQEVHDISTQIAETLKATLEGAHNLNPDGDMIIGTAFPFPDREVIVQLGILKAGCSFLPIDYDSFPARRILEIVDVIRPVLIIVHDTPEIMSKFNSVMQSSTCGLISINSIWTLLGIDSKPTKSAPQEKSKHSRQSLLLQSDYAQRPIAVYYEGGDLPVGIRISNDTVWNRVCWEWEAFPYGKDDVMTITSSCTSQCLGELFVPLLAGMPILITDYDHIDHLLMDVQKHQITRLCVDPQLLSSILMTAMLYHEDATGLLSFPNLLAKVKLFFCYRGALRAEVGRLFFRYVPKGCKLVQLYGAAETLQVGTYQVFDNYKSFSHLAFYELLPAGRPVTNIQIYVTQTSNDTEMEKMDVLNQGQKGEICITGWKFNLGYTMRKSSQPSRKIATSPFYKNGEDDVYTNILKTGDFGRILPSKSSFHKPHLQLDGRREYEYIVNNQRMNTKELVHCLKEIQDIRGCHVMVYRPSTIDQEVLAFVVLRKNSKSNATSIMEHLRKSIPEYMMPLIIMVEGIPVMPDSDDVDQNALMEAYYADRDKRQVFTDWKSLKLNSKGEQRAAEMLFEAIFLFTGISKTTIATNMDKWSVFKFSVQQHQVPLILLRLRRNGYNFDFGEFIKIPTVRELIKRMAARREAIGDNQKVLSQEFDVFIVSNKDENPIRELFVGHHSSSGMVGSVGYYTGIHPYELDKFFKLHWDLIMDKPLSVFVKRKKNNKIVAAMLTFDYKKKATSKGWSVGYPMKYRLELGDGFDDALSENKLSTKEMMQTEFFVEHTETFGNYENCLAIVQKMFEKTIEIGRLHNFKSHSVVSFNYVLNNIVKDLFQYKLLKAKGINCFQSSDGKKPFKLAPDYIVGNIIYKDLQK